MKETQLEPQESQKFYEFIMANRKKLPEIYEKIEGVKLAKPQLEEIYDIIARNRANSRGTRLILTTVENGEVTKIKGDPVKIPATEIKKKADFILK
jgi:hypothetical protein